MFSRVSRTPKGFFDGSVNRLVGAHEFGCAVAACSSDGSVAIISCSNMAGGGWKSEKISNEAHAVGCTGVSWGQNDEIASRGAITCARFGRELPTKEEEIVVIIINNNNGD